MQNIGSDEQVRLFLVMPKIILVLCQVVGLFPLNYAKNGMTIIFSKHIFRWNAACVTVMTSCSLLALYLDFTGYLSGQFLYMTSVTYVIAVFLDTVPIIILGVVSFISIASEYPKYIEMTLLLMKFDRRFYRKTKQISYKRKTLTALGLITVLYAWSVAYLVEKHILNTVYSIPLATYYTQLASLLHFTYIVESITSRFDVINHQIREELTKQIMSDVSITTAGKSAAASRLQSLINYYLNLHEATQLASDFFSSQLFVAILSSFLHITTTLYFLFASLWPTFSTADTLRFPLQVAWAFAHSLYLVLLVIPCTTLERVVSETAPMVCGLMNKNLSVNTTNQLESFLLNLLHLKVSFTASGFFNVRSSILTSILSSVTTYLVMFIQFYANESSEK